MPCLRAAILGQALAHRPSALGRATAPLSDVRPSPFGAHLQALATGRHHRLRRCEQRSADAGHDFVNGLWTNLHVGYSVRAPLGLSEEA
jgi:hypothetical protein